MAGQSSSSEIIIDKLLLCENERVEEDLKAKIEKLIADHTEKSEPCHCSPTVKRIIDGFLHFKACKFDKYPEMYEELAKAQHPKFLVFACSDSRVSPSHVLDFQPGEAFLACNVANLVPPFNKSRYSNSGAIIEFSVTALEVENILIIRHSRCGGIARLMTLRDDSSDENDFIDDWVKIGLSAKIKVKKEFENLPIEEQIKICERESVNNSLSNLLSYPYVSDGYEEKKIALWGGYYNFVDGSFELWEFKSEKPPIIIRGRIKVSP
ncbi:LOW QUALITY PROTEIN: carbonic anhydrase 2-like [Carica papaya]|uniref:LOW QUALITY PROTEIN: carbonic anhydrase 2-like n=1 Tax=Carica papaya TaxID=3649 RepID=UPI000B8C7545|nr:LOW QUALITY PROTEIN: carbonic anhydrase 2-like [Carica papaya]